MICTFFFFEGQFRQDDPDHPGKRLFSSALVPCANEESACEILKNELSEYNVDIISVTEQFIFDQSKFDLASKDTENLKFLCIYDEVKRFNRTIVLPFHMFDDDPSS
jgi:hypothetical protein